MSTVELIRLLEDKDVQKALQEVGSGLNSYAENDTFGTVAEASSQLLETGPIAMIFNMIMSKIRSQTMGATAALASSLMNALSRPSVQKGLQLFTGCTVILKTASILLGQINEALTANNATSRIALVEIRKFTEYLLKKLFGG